MRELMVGQTMYRAETWRVSDISAYVVIYKYMICSLTPKGMWVEDRYGRRTWRTRNTRYVSETPALARERLIARKRANVRHCEARLNRAKMELRVCENMEDE